MSVSPIRPRVSPAAVTLRPADAQDCQRIWLWRNDVETRQASFDSSPIPYESHARWFLDSLRNPDRKIYIVLAAGEAAGMVRLDLDGQQATVSINLAPEWRGRGVGPLALGSLAELAFGALGIHRLLASVKPDNRASLGAFEKAGFATSRQGMVVMLARSRHEG